MLVLTTCHKLNSSFPRRRESRAANSGFVVLDSRLRGNDGVGALGNDGVLARGNDGVLRENDGVLRENDGVLAFGNDGLSRGSDGVVALGNDVVIGLCHD